MVNRWFDCFNFLFRWSYLLCIHYSVAASWINAETPILGEYVVLFWFFESNFLEAWLLNLILLLNTSFFPLEKSFIAGFTSTFRLLMIDIWLKMKWKLILDFWIYVLEKCLLSIQDLMILFKVLVDHILLFIFGNTVAKVDGSIELRLIFL